MTTLYSYDPRTGTAFGDPVAVTDPAELDRIATAAREAAPAWRDSDQAVRAGLLNRLADALDSEAAGLAAIADRETALGEQRLLGEVARTSGQLRMFAAIVSEGSYVDAIISPADARSGRPDIRRMLRPVGPVAVFSASNFPFAFSVLGGDTASALAAGCPVVVKAHGGHPATSAAVAALVVRTLAEAGAPDGLFGIVYGTDAGRRLVQHPAITAVGFTGSTAGGRALFDLSCGRPDPIPFYGELGSVNPVVVLPGAARADAAAIAEGYVNSLTVGEGQFCTNPNLLFVPAESALTASIGAIVSGRSGSAMLTERIHSAYAEALDEPSWAELELVGGGSADGPWSGTPQVRLVELSQATAGLLNVERFGPAGLIVSYRSIEELLGALAELEASLTATVHADVSDHADAARLSAVLATVAGRLIMNAWPTGVAVCWAMHHGGPWPATTSAGHTSVGGTALRRWLTPVAYQDFPDSLLPAALQAGNPLGLTRLTQPDAT